MSPVFFFTIFISSKICTCRACIGRFKIIEFGLIVRYIVAVYDRGHYASDMAPE